MFLLSFFTELILSAGSDSINICVVDKTIIGDQAVEFTYMDTKYIFCNTGCEMLFKKEPALFTGGILKCMPCNDYDARIKINFIYGNVKYYFCSDRCRNKFIKAPKYYLKN